jgi:acyl-CoA synthetase (AMP-forming)/AMP-acid ligase II
MPRDGKSGRRFMVRGPLVVSGYYRGKTTLLEDSWSDAGHLAVMDDDNYIQLTDRANDVIKSGGEWISSIDAENLAMGCPGVAEAAVIGGSASEVGGTAIAGRRARRRRDGDGSLNRRAS